MSLDVVFALWAEIKKCLLLFVTHSIWARLWLNNSCQDIYPFIAVVSHQHLHFYRYIPKLSNIGWYFALIPFNFVMYSLRIYALGSKLFSFTHMLPVTIMVHCMHGIQTLNNTIITAAVSRSGARRLVIFKSSSFLVCRKCKTCYFGSINLTFPEINMPSMS